MARPSPAQRFDIAQRPRGRFFADELQLRRGDTAVLGRYVLAAERALDEIGLQAHLVSLTDMRTALDANVATWGGVAPIFDASQTTAHAEDVGVIMVTDAIGKAVGFCAQRFHDLGSRSVKDAIEDNSFMHGAHPAGDRSRVVFEVTAPAAAAITGRMTFLGGLWVHPEQRGSGITVLMVGLTRAYALGTWDFDTEVLVGRDKMVRADVMAQYAFAHSQRGYRHHVDGKLVYDGHFVWTRAGEHAARMAEQVERNTIARQREVAA